MKKFGLIFALSLCLSALIGCGGGSATKLPETKYEKVQYALNGVEKSLKNQKAASRSINLLPKERRSEADALNAIYNIFSDGTVGEPDFKYDEPPMIQFQYIKKALEKIGNGFDFGVKYQSTITGTIYFDFSTGEETQQADFKQDYSLDFSLYINIDDSDLITCKTLFDVNYVHASDTHHQMMYAELFLDYDMNKTDANYKLKLNAVDDCSDFVVDEERYFSAEFDYVDVSGDAIKDWGKIGYSTNKAIVLDESHSSLRDYLSDEDLEFKPTIQLYKDGKRYERNMLSNAEAIQASTISCDELGLNATDIKYKEYVRQSSTPQPVLKTCYEEFSQIFGRDLVYNLVYTGAKDKGGHGDGEEDGDRVDASWPAQDLIDDGYNGVPGFVSKTATFSDSKEYKSESGSYDHFITVLNFQDDDFARYSGTLIANGFIEDKVDGVAVYFHVGDGGVYDYAVAIYRIYGTDMIIVSKSFTNEDVKEEIHIQNGQDYTGDYSYYEEKTYQDASEVASILESVSGGQIKADSVAKYVIAKLSKSYEVHFNYDEFSGADVKDNYSEYVKLYSGWKVAHEGSAFYKTIDGIDVLIMMDKDTSKGIISIHSFAFNSGSIDEILNDQSQGGGGDHGGGGQEPVRVTVCLYKVNSKSGNTELISSNVFNEGEIINIEATFGPGKYYQDPECNTPISGDITVYNGLNIYFKDESQVQTQGTITIIDANTEEELYSCVDVLGATIKGGEIFSYVLYKDKACTDMVGLTEVLTYSEETITLYCRDYSEVDYVTLTVNTYINGILSPYHIRDFGIRRGEIMNNFSSYSFPIYYSDASFYDSNFTMTLNDNELGQYSQDLIALTENAVLNVYCNNDWCNVYHMSLDEREVDFLWEGVLTQGDVVLYGSRYYHISDVRGSSVSVDGSDTAYCYTLCATYNGKIITTQKEYFAIYNEDDGYFFFIDPNAEPYYFLDKELTTPLTPEEGKSEAIFKRSFTLYTRFSK